MPAFERFAPYLAQAFPETAASGGIIESELVAIPAMKARLEQAFARPVSGDLLLKRQSSADFRLHQGPRRYLRGADPRRKAGAGSGVTDYRR